jgi:hypothetical protein
MLIVAVSTTRLITIFSYIFANLFSLMAISMLAGSIYLFTFLLHTSIVFQWARIYFNAVSMSLDNRNNKLFGSGPIFFLLSFFAFDLPCLSVCL